MRVLVHSRLTHAASKCSSGQNPEYFVILCASHQAFKDLANNFGVAQNLAYIELRHHSLSRVHDCRRLCMTVRSLQTGSTASSLWISPGSRRMAARMLMIGALLCRHCHHEDPYAPVLPQMIPAAYLLNCYTQGLPRLSIPKWGKSLSEKELL